LFTPIKKKQNLGENLAGDIETIVEDFNNAKDEVVVFVIGAMSHGRVKVDYTDSDISFSNYQLSASVACGRLCSAIEKYWGIV